MKLPIVLAVALLTAPAAAQCSLEKLLADDLAAGDRFGNGVSIRGDLALVGSPYDETGDNNSGSAYVFRRVAGSWVQEQKLVPGDPDSNDHFGEAVAIAGDIAICGMEDDDDVMNGAGSAYVFRYNGSTWVFQQKLANPDPGVSEGFGWAVATNGAKLAISCKQDDALLANAGSVYVYREQGAAWVLEKKLFASDPQASAQFGDAIAYDADALVVGAWQQSGAATFTGAAYVFRDTGGTWPEEQKLVASDAASFDWFGRSVAVEGDLIAVGAYRADDAGSDGPGAVYAFRFDGATWNEEDKLVPSDWVGDDNNGWSCGVGGQRVFVGSRRNGEQGGSSGALYVFDHDGVSWNETLKLAAPDGLPGDELAWSLEASGNTVIAGAYFADAAGTTSGAAYIWELPQPGCLTALPESMSLASGGTLQFFLAGGQAHAGELVILLGSLSGTSPGIPLDGHVLPLVFDSYTQLTITVPGLIAGDAGPLGAAGQKLASLSLPGGLPPSLAGATLHHAFLLFDFGSFTVTQTSNASATAFTP